MQILKIEDCCGVHTVHLASHAGSGGRLSLVAKVDLADHQISYIVEKNGKTLFEQTNRMDLAIQCYNDNNW